MKTIARILGVALLLGAAVSTAFAGGPNYLYDLDDPYRWHLDHWSGGAVPVYTDLGGLGLLTNAQANSWTVAAWDQWNDVPTSTFRAQVVGDVGLLGLGDITLANVAQVFPAVNEGGVTVVYDYDGKIFNNYLGLTGVLGVAFPELAAPNSDELLESTVFINGFMQYFNDYDGRGLSGVFTHEFGHALNLRHSQANGAVWNSRAGDSPFPRACTGQPYAGGPGQGPSVQQTETMYPFLDQRPGQTSEGMFTPSRDDVQAISDLYPEPGWPESFGTIRGTVAYLTKILGNGGGPGQPIDGVNIIARNLADPYNDVVSTTTGEYTRGLDGAPAEGTYELHGLTPGATYVVYTDNFTLGAFPTPRLITLPGPEEWYNGTLESGNGETDDRCAWTGIPVAAAATATADITFNRVKGAPTASVARFAGDPHDMTADGTVMVGVSEANEQYWTWTGDGDVAWTTGAAAHFGGLAGISDDGTKVGGTAYDAAGVARPGIWENGAWTLTPNVPAQPGFSYCTDSAGSRWGLNWGFSGDGSTLVGSVYTRGCQTSGLRAATWTAANGWTILPKSPASPTRFSRAQAVSYDGSVVAGIDQNAQGTSIGVYWKNGVEYWPQGSVSATDWFGQVLDISRDGKLVWGGQAHFGVYNDAYIHNTETGEHTFPTNNNPNPNATKTSFVFRGDDYGKVGLGWDQVFGARTPTVWTPGLGWVNLTQFLEGQGLFLQDTALLNGGAISSDGTVWGLPAQSIVVGTRVPVRIDIPKAIVCHKSPGGHNTQTHNLDVAFPDGLGEHLAHGDTLGLCQHGGD